MASTPTPSDRDRASYRALQARLKAIVAGDAYPTMSDRESGMPPYRDSPYADLRYFAESALARDVMPIPVLDTLSKLAVAPGRWTAAAVHAACAACDFDLGLFSVDIDYNLALLGDEPASLRVISHILQAQTWGANRAYGLAFAYGLSKMYFPADAETKYSAGSHESIVDGGRIKLASAAQAFTLFELVDSEVDADAAVEAAMPYDLERDDLITAVLEDRAEMFADPGPRSMRGPRKIKKQKPGLMVVPAMPLPATVSPAKRDIIKSWVGKSGVHLPLVKRGDIAARRNALVSLLPHAAEVIDTILGDLAASDDVYFRPTLLVGPAGSGKSSLARAIADAFSMPSELVSFAGVHDASMMGTSAQWHTARESVPLQIIRKSGFANPLMIWDEIEKASESRHNGNPLDALLPMLEVDQARRYRDLALEVEVDLSMVSHIATANSVDGMPVPLRDRLRIIVMPEPGWQHLGTLTRGIIERLCAERKLDPRWVAPLAEDELDLIREVWPGGSIRQLTKIVRSLVDGRDQVIGTC